MNIKLKKTDCAIIINEKAEISYFLPTQGKEDASDGVLMATCIAVFLHDNDMLKRSREILHEQLKEGEEDA